MKIRRLMMLASLICLAIMSTAFVNTEKSTIPENIEDGEMSFAEFLSHFEKTELPFAIDLEELTKNRTSQQQVSQYETKALKKRVEKYSGLSLRGSKYIPEAMAMFSRMGPPHIKPVARFYLSEKLIAVIYSVQSRFKAGQKQYSMMVYDLKGKSAFSGEGDSLEQSFPLAHSSTVQTVACRIDEKGNIWKNTYKNVWEKDVRKKGIQGNQILDFKLTDTEVYKFSEAGTLVQLEELPVNDRTSLK